MQKRSVPDSVDVVRKFLLDNGGEIEPRFGEKFWSVLQRFQSLSMGAFVASVGVQLTAPSEGLRVSGQLELLESRVVAALMQGFMRSC